MSFIRVTWWSSSWVLMRSTFTSALSYFNFRASSSLDFFLKKPRKPFWLSSVASKPFSSPISWVMSSPVSPISLVRTRDSALSEKSLSFFWLAAPYCKIIWELVKSIFSAKSCTIFCSSGLSGVSSTVTGVAFLASSTTLASASGSRVRVGAAGAASKVREGAAGAFRSKSRSDIVASPFSSSFYILGWEHQVKF